MNRGFTLIELVISVAIFSLIVSAGTGLLIDGLKAQRRGLAYQQLADQVSFAVEDMSRAARMAKKELFNHTFSCLSTKGWNYENPGGDSSRLRFIKYDHDVEGDVCHEFFLEDGQIKEFRRDLATGVETTQDLTSSAIKANSLVFELAGETQSDDIQPQLTFFLDIESAGQKEEEKVFLNIQSSISQRNLDVRQ